MDEIQGIGEAAQIALGKPRMVEAPPGQRVLTAEELKRRPGLRGPNDRCRITGQVVAVLKNERTGEKHSFVTHNIVTDAGDRYYAAKAAGEAAFFAVAGMRLGTHAGAPAAPLKTDVKLQTTTGSTLLASSVKAIDATYPRTADPDTDNPGAGVDIVTWRVSYTTAEANSADIATLDLPDSLVDGSIARSLAIANFAAKFTKTSSDTLKVFVNHTMNGI